MASAPVNSQQRAINYPIPAPVGGLNGRDALSLMDALDAYELINMFPSTTSVEVRPGCTVFQAALGAPVSSLAVYASGSKQTIIAFAGSDAFDVTISGTLVSLRTDIASPFVQSVMFSTVADIGQFLICTTGEDTPMYYDGTTLADLAITGLSEPDVGINFAWHYQGRMFYGMRDRLGYYFLPPGQIQGVAQYNDLGQMSSMGGYLQAIATYSVDAFDGPADYIVFISNRGEYFMYQGTDPGDANAWSLVGRFRGPEPIGRNCVQDFAGDLLILTTEGVHQFSQLTKLGQTQIEAIAISAKLGSILAEHNMYRDVSGWSMQLWPVGSMLIINVPHSANPAGEYHQYVMNTITQAWCQFDSREWDANCFCMSNKLIYFGRYDGSIREVGGLYDNDNAIAFSAKQSYNLFGQHSYKHFKWAKFLVNCDSPVILSSQLSVDYSETAPLSVPSPMGAGVGAEWDVAMWDTASWGYGHQTQQWVSPYGNYGVAASHWLIGSISGASFEWYSTEHIYEPASGLL